MSSSPQPFDYISNFTVLDVAENTNANIKKTFKASSLKFLFETKKLMLNQTGLLVWKNLVFEAYRFVLTYL